MSQKKLNHVPFSEVVERIKDEISHDVGGKVFDRHVAEVLHISYSSLRCYKVTDYLPLLNVAIFCQEREISLDKLIFSKSVYSE